MLILWTCLVTAAFAQKVFESTEDIGPEAFQNVTTLYPIKSNNTYDKTTYNENNVTDNHITNNEKEQTDNNDNRYNENKEKLHATVWKIEAAFAESNLDKQKTGNDTIAQDKPVKINATQEFRPSPHLGSFYDEDSLPVTPTKATFVSYTPVRKPSSGFVSSKDDYRSSFKIPTTMLQTHKQYPYKYESPILARAKDPWKYETPDSLESRPTAEVPVKIPAGGSYKYGDPFNENPGKDGDDYVLGFNEYEKDTAVQKRVNPWENFLRLVTAFLPVGLIISALTPNIITIENTRQGVKGSSFPATVFRRSDPGPAAVPTISERCRRRLLCELHSDNNYLQPHKSPQSHGGRCHRIHCEDTEALARTLQWLLEYKQFKLKGHNT